MNKWLSMRVVGHVSGRVFQPTFARGALLCAALPVLLSGLFYAPVADAYYCFNPISALEQHDAADVVFSGKVRYVDSIGLGLDGLGSPRQRVTFDLRSVWKGIAEEATVIDVDVEGLYGYDFQSNQTYLVFGYRIHGDDRVSLIGCPRVQLLSDSAFAANALGEPAHVKGRVVVTKAQDSVEGEAHMQINASGGASLQLGAKIELDEALKQPVQLVPSVAPDTISEDAEALEPVSEITSDISPEVSEPVFEEDNVDSVPVRRGRHAPAPTPVAVPLPAMVAPVEQQLPPEMIEDVVGGLVEDVVEGPVEDAPAVDLPALPALTPPVMDSAVPRAIPALTAPVLEPSPMVPSSMAPPPVVDEPAEPAVEFEDAVSSTADSVLKLPVLAPSTERTRQWDSPNSAVEKVIKKAVKPAPKAALTQEILPMGASPELPMLPDLASPMKQKRVHVPAPVVSKVAPTPAAALVDPAPIEAAPASPSSPAIALPQLPILPNL